MKIVLVSKYKEENGDTETVKYSLPYNEENVKQTTRLMESGFTCVQKETRCNDDKITYDSDYSDDSDDSDYSECMRKFIKSNTQCETYFEFTQTFYIKIKNKEVTNKDEKLEEKMVDYLLSLCKDKDSDCIEIELNNNKWNLGVFHIPNFKEDKEKMEISKEIKTITDEMEENNKETMKKMKENNKGIIKEIKKIKKQHKMKWLNLKKKE